jgi:ferredoxin
MQRAKFVCLKNPALLTWHVINRLRLIDIHHAHGSAFRLIATDSAEVGLRPVFNRKTWRFLLLALLPALKLLAADQGDQQRQNSKQALLDMQWRDAQLGGTLAIHPETPPTLVVILLVGSCVVCPACLDYCSLHASFLKIKNCYKSISYEVTENQYGRILHDGPFTVVRNAR